VDISVVYITKNASRHFRSSIESILPVAGEIIVVDCGSADDTLAIARELGAKIYVREWSGFGAQRQFGISCARFDWVLVIDADELVDIPSLAALRTLVQPSNRADGYFLRRKNFIGGREIKYGDWSKDWVLRLFNRKKGSYDAGQVVHESWHCDGVVKRSSEISIRHYTFNDFGEMMQKLSFYAQLNAKKVVEKDRIVSPMAPMSHALWAFFRGYCLRLGFLDGVDGAAIAWTTALGSFMKYAIAREMQQAERR